MHRLWACQGAAEKSPGCSMLRGSTKVATLLDFGALNKEWEPAGSCISQQCAQVCHGNGVKICP